MTDNPLFVSTDGRKEFKSFVSDTEQYNNMKDCRIPSLLNVKKPDGTSVLIAAADDASSGADWGRIGIAVRRSYDNGNSFNKSETILKLPVRKYPETFSEWSAAFAIDPVLINAGEGRVVLLVDFFPECKGLHASKWLEKGSGYTRSNGEFQRTLFSGKTRVGGTGAGSGEYFTVRNDGFVYTSEGRKTNYYLPKNHNPSLKFETLGDMYYTFGEPEYLNEYPPLIPEKPQEGQDIYVGNIFLSYNKPEYSEAVPSFVEKRTVYESDTAVVKCIETSPSPLSSAVVSGMWCMISEDYGESFSQPFDITPYVKLDSDGAFFGTGPGIGIKLENGEYKNRLLAPVYAIGKAGVIISDDSGKTWRRAEKPYCSNFDECQLVSFENSVFCFGRPPIGKKTPLSVSYDGGSHFKKLRSSKLSSVHCQKSVISLPESFILPDGLVNDGSYIAACSPSGHLGKDKTRTDGLLHLGKISENKIHWIKTYNVKDKAEYDDFAEYSDFFAYSSIAALPDNTIGILYEAYPSAFIVLKKMSL